MTEMNLPSLYRSSDKAQLTPGLSWQSTTWPGAVAWKLQKAVQTGSDSSTLLLHTGGFSVERGASCGWCGSYRHHPARFTPASSCPVPLSVVNCTHWGYWRTGSTSVYTRWLRVPLMLASGIKAAFLFSCMSPCPPAAALTSTKESCEAEMEERLCDGAVLAMCVCACLPVWGREWQPGVTHLITLADWGLFLASSGTLLKMKLYAVFSSIIISSSRHFSLTVTHLTQNCSLFFFFYLVKKMLSHNPSNGAARVQCKTTLFIRCISYGY